MHTCDTDRLGQTTDRWTPYLFKKKDPVAGYGGLHTCNHRIWEADIERLWVFGQLQLHGKFGVGGQLAHTV